MINTKIKTNNCYYDSFIEWNVKSNKALTIQEIEEIKNYTTIIFFNEASGNYLIYDFKLKSSNSWVENTKINFDGDIWQFNSLILN